MPLLPQTSLEAMEVLKAIRLVQITIIIENRIIIILMYNKY
jgi:hypothetical protein